MRTVAATLEPLDNAARRRVLEWAEAVFGARGSDRTDEDPARPDYDRAGLGEHFAGTSPLVSPIWSSEVEEWLMHQQDYNPE
jgi:hypothetical protein